MIGIGWCTHDLHILYIIMTLWHYKSSISPDRVKLRAISNVFIRKASKLFLIYTDFHILNDSNEALTFSFFFNYLLDYHYLITAEK